MARRVSIYRKEQPAAPSLQEPLPFVAPLPPRQTESFFQSVAGLPQLDISQPGDALEHEADAVAERMTPANTTASSTASDNSETGFTLQPVLRKHMEADLNSDFSSVRLHTDNRAAQLSSHLNAQAFTVGHDVYFGEGQYKPATREGQKLLAHELTHVRQQATGQPTKIQRAVADADVEAEYTKWATANKKTTDKTKDDYPFDVWDFIRPQIVDTSMEPLPKPNDPKKLKVWTEAFEKAEIVARWLLAIRASASAADTLKDQADVRALMVLDAIARAGLITQAMNQASGLSADKRKSLYDTVLKNPSAASPAELVTIIAFQGASVADPASVPIVQTLTDGNSNGLKKLNAAQTKAIIGVLFKMYGSKEIIIKAIAEILMFNPAVRVAVSDAMMTGDIGSRDLLFAVLKHPYFIEPSYEGVSILKNLVPTDKTVEEYDNNRMKTDMPWVYTYKQKYYVQYLIDLAKAQSITIPPPARLDVATLKAWLEANTEKIGEAAKKAHPTNPAAVFELYRNIADIFFFHIPHDRDVEPDLEGKISHLKPGDPSKERFEADCDVFATYAMRLFYNAGFEPIGYLAIVPIGSFKDRAAHVAAIMRKDNAYYVINNKGILDPKQTETKPDDKKTDALKAMFKLALRDAYADPLPTERNVYYQDAGPKGQMTKAFKNQDSSLLRNDIP